MSKTVLHPVEPRDDGSAAPAPAVIPGLSQTEELHRDFLRLARYENELCAIVDIPRFRRIIEALAAKAEDGDVRAAKLLLGYLLPMPGEQSQIPPSIARTINVLTVNQDTYVKMREELRKAYVT